MKSSVGTYPLGGLVTNPSPGVTPADQGSHARSCAFLRHARGQTGTLRSEGASAPEAESPRRSPMEPTTTDREQAFRRWKAEVSALVSQRFCLTLDDLPDMSTR